jgi:flagellar hook-associated protein 2
MASVSSIMSQSGTFEGIVQQLVELEGRKKVEFESELNDQKKIETGLGSISGKITDLENLVNEYSQTTSKAFTPLKISSSDSDIVSITSATSLDTPDEYAITVNRLASRDNIISQSYTSTGTDLSDLGNGTVDLTIDGTTHSISISANSGESNSDVLTSLKTQIEAQFSEKVTVNVFDLDSTNVQLSIRSVETGYDSRVQFTNSSGSAAHIFDNATRQVATDQLDASFTLNGINFQRSSNTINDTISGLTFELQKTSSSEVKLELQRDTATARKNFDEFVKKYNDLNSELRSKTFINGETGSRGPLRELRSVRNLSPQLRQIVMGSTTGSESTITNLVELGISFDNTGKMIVDDAEKLTNVLENTPSDLKTFFAASSSPMQSLHSYLQSYTSSEGIIDTLEDVTDEKISLLNKKIKKEEKYLLEYEEKQRQIFTQLELILDDGESQFNQVMANLNNF